MSKSKYTTDFKKAVLLCGLDREVAQMKKYFYKEYWKQGLYCMYIASLSETRKDDFLNCAFLLNLSKKRKAAKVRSKVGFLVKSNNAIFLTLTFTDETLSKTSAETRRRYVARYLKGQCQNYVANIDFGGKNGREHYHAIVDGEIDFSEWHNYGAIKAERINTSDSDLIRTSLYVSKLSNHALKVKGNIPRLIYSRD